MTNTIAIERTSLYGASNHTMRLTHNDVANYSLEERETIYNAILDGIEKIKKNNGITAPVFAISTNWSKEDRQNFSILTSNKIVLERYSVIESNNAIKAMEREEREARKIEREAKRLENKNKREQAKKNYENSHLYFNVNFGGDGIAKKQLGGFILSNSIVISNYTSDGYIIITVDKLNRPFISVNTRVKDNNGGNCRAKKELLSLTRDRIKDNVLSALKGREWSEILKVVENIKSFKKECKNARINELVKSVEYNASKFDK